MWPYAADGAGAALTTQAWRNRPPGVGRSSPIARRHVVSVRRAFCFAGAEEEAPTGPPAPRLRRAPKRQAQSARGRVEGGGVDLLALDATDPVLQRGHLLAQPADPHPAHQHDDDEGNAQQEAGGDRALGLAVGRHFGDNWGVR